MKESIDSGSENVRLSLGDVEGGETPIDLAAESTNLYPFRGQRVARGWRFHQPVN